MNRLNQIILEGTVSGELIIPTDGHCKMIIPTTYTRTAKDTKEVFNIYVECNYRLSSDITSRLTFGRVFRVVGYLATDIINGVKKLVIISDHLELKPMKEDGLTFWN